MIQFILFVQAVPAVFQQPQPLLHKKGLQPTSVLPLQGGANPSPPALGIR